MARSIQSRAPDFTLTHLNIELDFSTNLLDDFQAHSIFAAGVKLKVDKVAKHAAVDLHYPVPGFDSVFVTKPERINGGHDHTLFLRWRVDRVDSLE